jgi:hypothetical protein
MTIHYKQMWFFKRSNLTKMSTSTKGMTILIKHLGHERHDLFFIEKID